MTIAYIWDTHERQQTSKPYGFFDFPDNFLDIYLTKRFERLLSLKSRLSKVEKNGKYEFSRLHQAIIYFSGEIENDVLQAVRSSAEQDDQLICHVFGDVYSAQELQGFDEFVSQKVIYTLYETLRKNNEFLHPEYLKHFRRLLKKAELRKLTAGYNNTFINVTKDSLPVEAYCYLALCLAMYSNQGDIQSLSTLLKVNDYLASIGDSLTDAFQLLALYITLRIERRLVKAIAKDKGVYNED